MLDTAKIPRGTARKRSPSSSDHAGHGEDADHGQDRGHCGCAANPPSPTATGAQGLQPRRRSTPQTGWESSVRRRPHDHYAIVGTLLRPANRPIRPWWRARVRGARMDRYANTCPWRTCRLLMALGRSNRKLTLAYEIATAVRAGPCIHRVAGLPPYSLLTLHDDLDLAAWIERWGGAWRCAWRPPSNGSTHGPRPRTEDVAGAVAFLASSEPPGSRAKCSQSTNEFPSGDLNSDAPVGGGQWPRRT